MCLLYTLRIPLGLREAEREKEIWAAIKESLFCFSWQSIDSSNEYTLVTIINGNGDLVVKNERLTARCYTIEIDSVKLNRNDCALW